MEYLIQEFVGDLEQASKTISSEKGSVFLGRSDEVSIHFAENDRTVSRKQFRIDWEKGGVSLENLGRNPVRLENRETCLMPGKKILIREKEVACFETTRLSISKKCVFPICRLTFRTDSGVKTRRLETNASYSIGRIAENDIQLSAVSVSSQHCSVFPASDGRLWITDLNSKNGIKIQDGDKVVPLEKGRSLESDDCFFMGDVVVGVDFLEASSVRKKPLFVGAGVLLFLLFSGMLLASKQDGESSSNEPSSGAIVASVLAKDSPLSSKGRELASLADASLNVNDDVSLFCTQCSDVILELVRLKKRMGYEQQAITNIRKSVSKNPWNLSSYGEPKEVSGIRKDIDRCVKLLKDVVILSERMQIPMDSTRSHLKTQMDFVEEQLVDLESFYANAERLKVLVQKVQKNLFSFVEKEASFAEEAYLLLCPSDQRFSEDLHVIKKASARWMRQEEFLLSQIEEWSIRYNQKKALFPCTIDTSGINQSEAPLSLHFKETPLPSMALRGIVDMASRLSSCVTDLDVLDACEQLSHQPELLKNQRTKALLSKIRHRASLRVSNDLDEVLAKMDFICSGRLDASGVEEFAVEVLENVKRYNCSRIRQTFPEKHNTLVTLKTQLLESVLSKARELYTQGTVSSEKKDSFAEKLKFLSEEMLNLLDPEDLSVARYRKKFEKLKDRAESGFD